MSGTYQSRVFTFINKRTNRLKDTCAQGFRQIKVAVVWSGQILLYPLQLLAEKVKIFQPQLTPPPQQRSLPQPVSDINIEQALELIAEAGHPIEIAQKSGSLRATARSKNLPPEVSRDRGLQLTNQNSSNLGYYDPDTDDWEIASYSPRQSSQVTAKKPTIRGLSSLLVDRRLVLVTIENDLLDILSISQQQEIRRRMGIDLAVTWHQWHTATLAGEHLPQQLSTTLTSSQQLTIAASDENPSAPNLFDLLLEQPRQRLHHWWQSFTSESPTALHPQPETQPLRQLSANYSFTPQPPSINRFLELPQLPPITQDSPSSNPDTSIANRIFDLQPDWFKQWVNSCRDYLYIPPTDDYQIVHQPAEFELTTIETKPQKNRTKEYHNSSDLIFTEDRDRNKQKQKHDRSSNQIDPSLEYYQDWIEADSELIGYSQSPLAKLLAWFDRIILRIENWLIKIWHTITNRLARTESK